MSIFYMLKYYNHFINTLSLYNYFGQAFLFEHRKAFGFRVEPNEVRFVSRKPFSVFSIHFVTRTPKSIRFSSRTERSEVHIEKTTIGVLDTLRNSNTEYSRFSSRTERSEVRIEKTILSLLDTLRYSNTEYSRFSSRTERSEVRIEKTFY